MKSHCKNWNQFWLADLICNNSSCWKWYSYLALCFDSPVTRAVSILYAHSSCVPFDTKPIRINGIRNCTHNIQLCSRYEELMSIRDTHTHAQWGVKCIVFVLQNVHNWSIVFDECEYWVSLPFHRKWFIKHMAFIGLLVLKWLSFATINANLQSNNFYLEKGQVIRFNLFVNVRSIFRNMPMKWMVFMWIPVRIRTQIQWILRLLEWNLVAGCNFSFESPFFCSVSVCGFLVCCLFRCVWLFKNCCLWHESPSIYFVISYTQLNWYIWYVYACACMCLVALPSVWVTWSDYCVYASNTEYIYTSRHFFGFARWFVLLSHLTLLLYDWTNTHAPRTSHSVDEWCIRFFFLFFLVRWLVDSLDWSNTSPLCFSLSLSQWTALSTAMTFAKLYCNIIIWLYASKKNIELKVFIYFAFLLFSV